MRQPSMRLLPVGVLPRAAPLSGSLPCRAALNSLQSLTLTAVFSLGTKIDYCPDGV
jgi:hypothetical protein